MTESHTLEVGVKIFITNSDGKFLTLKRAKPYHGETFCRWDIPGGRINLGEPHLKALEREIKEETGLSLQAVHQITGVQDILRVPGKHTIRITYTGSCTHTDNIKIDPNEHSAYRWVTLRELQKLKHDTFLTPLITTLLAKEEK